MRQDYGYNISTQENLGKREDYSKWSANNNIRKIQENSIIFAVYITRLYLWLDFYLNGIELDSSTEISIEIVKKNV